MRTFFPRGTGPLVSILLPSCRPEEMGFSLRSLYYGAKDKSLLEFCIKVDDDRPDCIEAAQGLVEEFIESKVIVEVSPRGRGYADVCEWLESLARQSSGDWIFVWDDGARMMSKDWDQYLLYSIISLPWVGVEEICYMALLKYNTGSSTAQQYLLRRGVFNLLGHVGKYTTGDDWMGIVMTAVQPRITLTVEVEHESPGDEILRNNRILEDTMRRASRVRKDKVRDILLLSKRLDYLEKERLKKGPPEPRTWSVYVDKNIAEAFVVHEDGTGDYMEEGDVKQRPLPTGGRWAVISRW